LNAVDDDKNEYVGLNTELTISVRACRKTGKGVSREDYLLYKAALAHPSSTSAPTLATDDDTEGDNRETERDGNGGGEGAEAVLSFAQLQALIESGQTHLIPNNRIVPDGLNVRTLLSALPPSHPLTPSRFDRTPRQARRQRRLGQNHGRSRPLLQPRRRWLWTVDAR
jgi:hypothetical protein